MPAFKKWCRINGPCRGGTANLEPEVEVDSKEGVKREEISRKVGYN
jgi:hypothetical protein